MDDRSWDDQWDALAAAQDLANHYGHKVYVLRQGDGTFRVDEQYNDEEEIVDEALPD